MPGAFYINTNILLVGAAICRCSLNVSHAGDVKMPAIAHSIRGLTWRVVGKLESIAASLWKYKDEGPPGGFKHLPGSPLLVVCTS